MTLQQLVLQAIRESEKHPMINEIKAFVVSKWVPSPSVFQVECLTPPINDGMIEVILRDEIKKGTIKACRGVGNNICFKIKNLSKGNQDFNGISRRIQFEEDRSIFNRGFLNGSDEFNNLSPFPNRASPNQFNGISGIKPFPNNDFSTPVNSRGAASFLKNKLGNNPNQRIARCLLFEGPEYQASNIETDDVEMDPLGVNEARILSPQGYNQFKPQLSSTPLKDRNSKVVQFSPLIDNELKIQEFEIDSSLKRLLMAKLKNSESEVDNFKYELTKEDSHLGESGYSSEIGTKRKHIDDYLTPNKRGRYAASSSYIGPNAACSPRTNGIIY